MSTKITALITVPPSSPGANPYIDLFCRSLPDQIRVLRFSWRGALLQRYDIVHVQWPEYVLASESRAKQLSKAVLGALFILRLRLLRVPVVYTAHNLTAHEPPSRIAARLTRALMRTTTTIVYLNDSSENDPSRGVVIRHAAYPASPRRRERESHLLLFFGQVRPYKGIESLIEVYAKLCAEEPRARLRIVGHPADAAYAASITELAARQAHVEVDLTHQDERTLEEHIDAASVVVLPYRRIYNSGAAVLALGRGATILAPAAPATRSLRDEVGDAVRLFDPPLTSADLRAALENARERRPSGGSALSGRDPATIGRLHALVYEALAKRSALTPADLRQIPGVARHSSFNTAAPSGEARR